MEPSALAVIESVEQAAAVLDPIRHRILETLREPQSCAAVARRLGMPRQRLNYHVRELERVGLVRHVADRRRGNCIERVLQATATRYLVSPEVLGRLGLEPGNVPDRTSGAYLVALAAETIRNVADLQHRAEATGRQLPTFALETEIRFASPAAQNAFADELAATLSRLAAKYRQPGPPDGRRSFRFVVTGYPASPRSGVTVPRPATRVP